VKLIAALFFLTAAPAIEAADEPESRPATDAGAYLKEAFGKQGLATLHERGFVSVTSSKDRPAVLHVQWPLFERFRDDAPAYRAFLDAYRKNRSRLSVEGSLKALRILQKRPLGGAMTPSLRAAVDALAALLTDAGALDKRLAAAPEQKNLFSTRWGKQFFDRHSGVLLSSPKTAASEFFDQVLVPETDKAPARLHAAKHVEAVSGEKFSARLEADLASRKLSGESKAALAAYLDDQRKLWTVVETKSRLKEIERAGSLRKDATALEQLLSGFEKKPGLLKELRARLSAEGKGEGAGPLVRFSGPHLHVHAGDGSPTLDAGDTAVVSMAYWVYGVPDGEELQVSQLAFVDRGSRGIEHRSEEDVRVKNGGPYTFSVKVPIRTDAPFTFRLFLDAEGAEPLAREVEVQPSPRYREILALAAEGDREASACMLSDAGNRYDAAIEALGETAGKPRFDALRKRVEERKRKVQHQAELKERLDGAIDGARLFASAEQCDFRDDRARNALSLLSELPAGCDALPEERGGSLSAHLRGLMRASQRRREVQDSFDKAVKKARDLERRCRTERAVSLYAGGLALLDAEPAARCGDWEQNYTIIRIEDLPRAAGAARIGSALSAIADDAERRFNENDARGALQRLLPALAKVEALPDAGCYDSSRDRLAGLAEKYGAALGPGSPGKTAERAKLPKDATGAALKTVLKERQRRNERRRADTAAERRRQTPMTAAPEGE
jgi:hypothetical protein